MKTGDALSSFVGRAALAVERACTITEGQGETDTIFCTNSKEPIL